MNVCQLKLVLFIVMIVSCGDASFKRDNYNNSEDEQQKAMPNGQISTGTPDSQDGRASDPEDASKAEAEAADDATNWQQVCACEHDHKGVESYFKHRYECFVGLASDVGRSECEAFKKLCKSAYVTTNFEPEEVSCVKKNDRVFP